MSERKPSKYRPLITSLSPSYQEVTFVNVSMSALGVLENSCFSPLKPLKDLDLPEIHRKRLRISKIMLIAIRSIYITYFAAETRLGQT